MHMLKDCCRTYMPWADAMLMYLLGAELDTCTTSA